MHTEPSAPRQRATEAGTTAEAHADAAGRHFGPSGGGSGLRTTAPTAWSTLAMLLPEFKLMIGLVSSAVLIAALYFGRDILIPLALAFLFGFVLEPLVTRLKRWGLPRAAAVTVVMITALAAIGGAGLFIAQQVSALSAELPTYQANIGAKLHEIGQRVRAPGMFDGVVKTFEAVRKEVEADTPPADEAAATTPTTTPTKKGEKGAAAARATPPPLRVQVEEKAPAPMRNALAWFEAASGPLASAGIALVFVVLVLLDRLDLRDRLLRLWGGSLHRSTDAMDEAGRRISKYLTMQLVVNLSYGVPLGAGLWLIGVPGALLWGALGALMRFVPYLGPMISAVFPVALAFAVDPGWTMLVWTVGLIVVLELIGNNLVEPWLYGASTGLSAMSLMVAATFWTALWGPIGLIMSTPLTVCLLVVGRHLPRLKFLDVLLGSQPALDTPTRVYQRLLAGDVDEAIELAADEADKAELTAVYDDIGLAVLRMATADHTSVATTEHRHRIVVGMDALLDDLNELHPAPDAAGRPAVVCIGGKWEVDNLAARMLAHALSAAGQPAAWRPAAAVSADHVAALDLDGVRTVCLSYFSPEPEIQARHFCRRLRRRWPEVQVVLALWNAPPELQREEAGAALGAEAVVTSVTEAVLRTAQLSGAAIGEGFAEAAIPVDDAARLDALHRSGALDPRAKALLDAAAKRAADIFDVPMALISLIDTESQDIRGAFGQLPASAAADGTPREPTLPSAFDMPRQLSICGHVVAGQQTLVVPDVARDLRFAANPTLRERGLRFYAGAPLRDADQHVLGTLCLLDAEPRTLTKREVRLLESMADDVMAQLRTEVATWTDLLTDAAPLDQRPSAIVGQMVPAAS